MAAHLPGIRQVRSILQMERTEPIRGGLCPLEHPLWLGYPAGSGGFSRFGRSGLTIHTFLLKSHKQYVHFL